MVMTGAFPGLLVFLICLVLISALLAINFISIAATRKRKAMKTLIEPTQDGLDLLRDPEVRQLIDQHSLIAAVQALRKKTGLGYREAKDLIDYYVASTDVLVRDDVPPEQASVKKAPPSSLSDQGIRRLIENGQIEEAVEAYRLFTGVDVFSARDAVEQIRQDVAADNAAGSETGETKRSSTHE